MGVRRTGHNEEDGMSDHKVTTRGNGSNKASKRKALTVYVEFRHTPVLHHGAHDVRVADGSLWVYLFDAAPVVYPMAEVRYVDVYIS
jgi:hypothetical protein